MSDEEIMRYVVELSRAKMLEHQGGPFAAVVVLDGKIVGEGWNCVTSSNDPTAHAEMTAIRAACESLDTYSLEGASIYTSCEPCPMCLGAIYWARIARVYYANTTQDAAAIGFDDGLLYREIALPAEDRTISIVHLALPEAAEVFAEWERMPDKVPY